MSILFRTPLRGSSIVFGLLLMSARSVNAAELLSDRTSSGATSVIPEPEMLVQKTAGETTQVTSPSINTAASPEQVDARAPENSISGQVTPASEVSEVKPTDGASAQLLSDRTSSGATSVIPEQEMLAQKTAGETTQVTSPSINTAASPEQVDARAPENTIPGQVTPASELSEVKPTDGASAQLLSDRTSSGATSVIPEPEMLTQKTAGETTQVTSPSIDDTAASPEQIDSSASETTLQGQVTSVSQLSDVKPTDWAFQALQSLVERYGCIAGYPDGTFRGNRAMTRYEFAAGLNACLDQVTKLIGSSTANFVSKEDLAVLQKLQEEFAAELATLRGRIDILEARTANLESKPVLYHNQAYWAKRSLGS